MKSERILTSLGNVEDSYIAGTAPVTAPIPNTAGCAGSRRRVRRCAVGFGDPAAMKTLLLDVTGRLGMNLETHSVADNAPGEERQTEIRERIGYELRTAG